jgi:hypothetical protein
MSNWLDNLKLDVWYKAFVYVGGVGFLLSLLKETKGMSNGQVQLFTSGLFFIGLGEWKNWKLREWIKPANAFTGGAAFISEPVRVPDLVGILLLLLGTVLFAAGLISVLRPLA